MVVFQSTHSKATTFIPAAQNDMVRFNVPHLYVKEQGVSVPVSYGVLVFRFKRMVGKPIFSDQFKKIIKRYQNVRFNLDIA